MARPSLYKEEYNDQVTKLCRLGAIDAELADFFGISEATLNNWKNQYPEFLESIKKGRQDSDAEVANKLYNRAVGYDHKEIKVFCYRGDIITKEITAHYPPDPTSMIFWLKNRRPDLWRDVHDINTKIDPSNIDEVIQDIKKALNENI